MYNGWSLVFFGFFVVDNGRYICVVNDGFMLFVLISLLYRILGNLLYLFIICNLL